MAPERMQTALATGTMAAPTQIAAPHNTHAKRRWRRFLRNRLSVLGAAIVLFLIALALVGPSLAPYPRDATGAVHISDRLKPPSAAHLLGTDDVGRDILSRMLVGSRLTLGAGVTVLLIAVALGTLLGAVSGFQGGRTDTLIQRVTEVFLTVPDLILAMAVSAALGPSLINVVIAISLVWWPGYCRLVRAEVLRTRTSCTSRRHTPSVHRHLASCSGMSCPTSPLHCWSKPRWILASRC